MKSRRTFIHCLGVIFGSSFDARGARPGGKPFRVGFLEAGSRSVNAAFLASFMQGIRQLGYVEGQDIQVAARWAEGDAQRFPKLYAELDSEKPDVIVVASNVGALAARNAASSTPVVFVGVNDPVGTGLVHDLARPGGRLTGLTIRFGQGLVSKAVQLLKEAVPGASRLAVLLAPFGTAIQGLEEARAAGTSLGMIIIVYEVHQTSDFFDRFARMRQQGVDSLMVISGPLTVSSRDTIVKLAASHHIPSAYEFPEFARAGGLLAYGASIPAQFKRAATYVDKILRGMAPGDLPVEQPTDFELVVNLTTARALGINIPSAVLLRADELIH